ncbi:MAG: NAD(P)/FAD-dependent oxidoreductase [Saccharospirillaceae bacterium]|nr:NAD(P)/FAD-dependent oxidoreductase [Pseudomonadales bacterium]NRB78263.1 NAD(P)/FAD-dependent oxidoreductase [Saccharospirillaceae bacterium]
MNTQKDNQKFDCVIIGAGAAGLFAAYSAGKRHKRVLVIDHANKIGKKILMSGGGRCNFTNYFIEHDRYLSTNPHFFKSALAQFSQWSLIELICEYGLEHYEKELGQLFCQHKSSDFLDFLKALIQSLDVEVRCLTTVNKIQSDAEFTLDLTTSDKPYQVTSESLIIATGGLSIPTMGATGFGYEVAKQFGHKLLPTRAGLVPFTWNTKEKERLATLSGTALPVRVSIGNQSFAHQLLFTHRGLSGPAILQISNYWNEGQSVAIDLLPDQTLSEYLQTQSSQKALGSILKQLWPNKFVQVWFDTFNLSKQLAQLSNLELSQLDQHVHAWRFKPGGTEGYRTAEVTLGGVSCDEVSSKTLESQFQPKLYFVGEVLDVTGHLGGFNFQWAFSSGFVAGQNC